MKTVSVLTALLMLLASSAFAKVPSLNGTYRASEQVVIDGKKVTPEVRFVSSSIPALAGCNVSNFCNKLVYKTEDVSCSTGKCPVISHVGAEVIYTSQTDTFTLRYVYMNPIYRMVDEVFVVQMQGNSPESSLVMLIGGRAISLGPVQ